MQVWYDGRNASSSEENLLRLEESPDVLLFPNDKEAVNHDIPVVRTDTNNNQLLSSDKDSNAILGIVIDIANAQQQHHAMAAMGSVDWILVDDQGTADDWKMIPAELIFLLSRTHSVAGAIFDHLPKTRVLAFTSIANAGCSGKRRLRDLAQAGRKGSWDHEEEAANAKSSANENNLIEVEKLEKNQMQSLPLGTTRRGCLAHVPALAFLAFGFPRPGSCDSGPAQIPPECQNGALVAGMFNRVSQDI